MKKTKNLLLLLFLPLLFTDCEKTDDGSYVEPITVYEKLAGTWDLTSIKLIDEIAKANNITPNEVELISKFGFSDMSITLGVDTDSLPTTYEVTGSVPELFHPNGYWDLDSPFTHSDGTPTEMYLYTDAAKTQLADKLSITAIPGTRAELEFKLIRMSGETAYASYVYKFRLDQ
jgi:hypothetical protein